MNLRQIEILRTVKESPELAKAIIEALSETSQNGTFCVVCGSSCGLDENKNSDCCGEDVFTSRRLAIDACDTEITWEFSGIVESYYDDREREDF